MGWSLNLHGCGDVAAVQEGGSESGVERGLEAALAKHQNLIARRNQYGCTVHLLGVWILTALFSSLQSRASD